MQVPRFVSRIRESLRRITRPAVLCAEDDDDVRVLLVAALARAGFAVDTATDGREALDLLRGRRYAAVVLDLGLPYLHGATLLSVIRQENPEMLRKLTVVTGLAEAALVDIEPQVAAVLRKPVNVKRLVETVRDCVEPATMVLRTPAA